MSASSRFGRAPLVAAYRAVERSAARDVLYAARTLASELRMLLVHRRGARRARETYAGQVALRLHLGCGDDLRAGWVNADLADGVDVCIDVRRPLPFADGAATIVHSEHLVEHLEEADAVRLFRECHRVLEPGGELSVCVPDARAPLFEYVDGDGPLLAHARDAGWHGDADTRLAQINVLFRQGSQHRYAYDAETLVRRLRLAGFDEAAERPFRPGLDSEARRLGSLYVSAVKGDRVRP